MEKIPISNIELDLLLESHRKYLLREGDGILLELENRIIDSYDFSGKDCENAQFLSCIFKYDSEGEELYNHQSGEVYYAKPNGTTFFAYTNFTNVNFTGTVFTGVFDFDTTRLNNAIFINVDWNKLRLDSAHKAVIITTVSQLTSKIAKQNSVIDNNNQKIDVKNRQLDQTSERESKGLLDIFEDLKGDFLFEEIAWMVTSCILGMLLLFIGGLLIGFLDINLSKAMLYIITSGIYFILFTLFLKNHRMDKSSKDAIGPDSFFEELKYLYNEYFKYINKWNKQHFVFIAIAILLFFAQSYLKNAIPEIIKSVCGDKSCLISMGGFLPIFTPISFIIISMLWFSVHQYGRAKKLRIEQQNKQAMIHFMQAIIANDGKVSKENQNFPMLAPFFANAIIHRPFSQENYEPQLPIDKLFELAKNTKDLVK